MNSNALRLKSFFRKWYSTHNKHLCNRSISGPVNRGRRQQDPLPPPPLAKSILAAIRFCRSDISGVVLRSLVPLRSSLAHLVPLVLLRIKLLQVIIPRKPQASHQSFVGNATLRIRSLKLLPRPRKEIAELPTPGRTRPWDKPAFRQCYLFHLKLLLLSEMCPMHNCTIPKSRLCCKHYLISFEGTLGDQWEFLFPIASFLSFGILLSDLYRKYTYSKIWIFGNSEIWIFSGVFQAPFSLTFIPKT